MHDAGSIIDSADAVKKSLEQQHKIITTVREITSVMRKDLKMRYKKIVPVSLHANSQKNLVCRQQFALKFLELLQSGKTILNIDETWLGMSDFRRRKW